MVCDRRKQTLVVTLFLVGCAGDDGYQAISGRVNFKGTPLKQGSIQFCSLGEKSSPCAGAMIQDGTYHVPRDHGLVPGTYLVKISSAEKDETAKGGSTLNPVLVQERIPPLWNKESTHKVEIVAGGSRQFDFDIE
jgi:hypothetical protein